MARVAILLADGFETAEALTTADVLRRAGIKTRLVSTMDTAHVITAQQVQVTADETLDTAEGDVDCYVVPGGTPGVKRLSGNARVRSLLSAAMADPSVTVAAICAGPALLGELGVLEGRKATVFPGLEGSLPAGTFVDEEVVVDRDLIAARSMCCALPFALALVERLAGSEALRKVLGGIGEPCAPAGAVAR